MINIQTKQRWCSRRQQKSRETLHFQRPVLNPSRSSTQIYRILTKIAYIIISPIPYSPPVLQYIKINIILWETKTTIFEKCLRALPKSAWRILETESETEIMYFKPRRILRRDVIFISLTEIPYNTNYVLNNPRSSFLPHWRSKVRLLFLRTKDKQLKKSFGCCNIFKYKVYSSSKSYKMLK